MFGWVLFPFRWLGLLCKKKDDAESYVEENDVGEDVESRNTTIENRQTIELRATITNEQMIKNSTRKGIITDLDTQSAIEEGEVVNFKKDNRSYNLIKTALISNDFITNLMDDQKIDAVIEAMQAKEFQKGAYIIKEGESGSHLFVSDEGRFVVFKGGKIIKEFQSGEVFGELAVLYKAKRFASIIAASDSKIWSIERRVFQKIMVRSVKQELENNIKFLASVPDLKGLNEQSLIQMHGFLKREFFPPGATIIRQGEIGDKFYIIRGGTVHVTKHSSEGGPEVFQVELTRGDYFGEQALIKSDTRLATVTATKTGAECLTMLRGPFHEFLGNLDEIVIKQYEQINAPAEDLNIPEEYAHIHLDHLRIIGTLGTGAFGRVELVYYSHDDKTFALKCLKKCEILINKQQKNVFNEKRIMYKCNSRFICRLFKTFKDNKYLYFLMEPILGGDVWTILQKYKTFNERTSRFMTACVVEAFDYLHSFNIIYRDLKPENLMIDSKGYIKLVDFGYAKYLYNDYKTYTFAGTPEYVAPEIVLNHGHDRAVDYWALGILVHEFFTGYTPFQAKTHVSTYKLILRGIDNVELNKRIPSVAQALMRSLCRITPSERLGYLRNGIKDIKSHRWFEGFSWERLKKGKLPAPLLVPIANDKDLSNCGKYDTDDTPPDEISGWDVDF